MASSGPKSQAALRLPPNQQLIKGDKWPFVGERQPGKGDDLWTISVIGLVKSPLIFTVQQLAGFPQTEMTLDIHCVTRWTRYDMQFSGVLLRDFLRECQPDSQSKFVSFIARSDRNHSSSLPLEDAISLGTLLATHVNGRPLPTDHGGPIRGIVPRRYFYKSVKWLETIELLEHDRLGYWEAEAGYHNHADPWQEQRFMACNISKRRAAELIESRDFTDGDLRGIDATNRNLDGLNAHRALLRDSNFNGCSLVGADFREANLSGARFRKANLVDADFRGADIEGADFAGANLANVNFEDCSFFGASFCDLDDDGSWIQCAEVDVSTKFQESQLESLTEEQSVFLNAKRND